MKIISSEIIYKVIDCIKNKLFSYLNANLGKHGCIGLLVYISLFASTLGL